LFCIESAKFFQQQQWQLEVYAGSFLGYGAGHKDTAAFDRKRMVRGAVMRFCQVPSCALLMPLHTALVCIQVEAKLADLQQQQKLCRLQQQTLKASIDQRRRRYADTKRRLAACEG
jgi:hypothetical protein